MIRTYPEHLPLPPVMQAQAALGAWRQSVTVNKIQERDKEHPRKNQERTIALLVKAALDLEVDRV